MICMLHNTCYVIKYNKLCYVMLYNTYMLCYITRGMLCYITHDMYDITHDMYVI